MREKRTKVGKSLDHSRARVGNRGKIPKNCLNPFGRELEPGGTGGLWSPAFGFLGWDGGFRPWLHSIDLKSRSGWLGVSQTGDVYPGRDLAEERWFA